MSNYAPAPHKPDSRTFASYPMPAKIDLINERPRRESVVERQLENTIGESILPRIEISERSPTPNTSAGSQMNYASTYHQQENQDWTQNYNQNQRNQQQVHQATQQQHWNQQGQQQMVHQIGVAPTGVNNSHITTTTQTTVTKTASNNAAILAAELAQKEARLMADINALHSRPYSPFQVPSKIDLTNEQRIAQQQYQQAPSPRPTSRASSTRSVASADFLDKEAKLLQEIEEMERKPYNPQRMVVEREQWFEYPEGRPYDRQLTDSKRRVKDFCSLPSHMYPNQGTHIHEENLPASTLGRPNSSASSVHTTIIRSPRREVDNKSPLPFAFDNFSTKGVRGNIASVGAVEPERPRPPIYPIIKRSPSPNLARG